MDNRHNSHMTLCFLDDIGIVLYQLQSAQDIVATTSIVTAENVTPINI